jgi:predicted acyl esterase
MSDGTVLRGDVRLPADASSTQVPGRFPVITTITAYNKHALGNGGDLAGAAPSYLVKRGYAHLIVDARGTGSSGGSWCAFCARENRTRARSWPGRTRPSVRGATAGSA